jgi:hypothetical protein
MKVIENVLFVSKKKSVIWDENLSVFGIWIYFNEGK